MATIPTEHRQPSSRQNFPRQRLSATREEVILLSHLLQAAWEVERDSPVRRAIVSHWNLVRTVFVMLVIGLSIVLGSMAPQILQAIGH